MKHIVLIIGLVFTSILLQGWSKDLATPAPKLKPIGRAELYWLMNRACWHGDELSVQMLLDAGADPNGIKDYSEFKRFEPSWPINQASNNGHLEVVNLLLKAGAKVDALEGEGYTALAIAVSKNHPKVVQRLVDAGADISYKTPEGTALDIATAKGFKGIVKILAPHHQQHQQRRQARSRL